jgi:hypothetical protein
MKWYGNQAKAVVSTATPEALQRAAEQLLARSQELVPVNTGELKESGAVVDGMVVYTADHAIPVHENLEARHPRGQAKFLEAAVNQFGDEYLKLLTAELDEVLR